MLINANFNRITPKPLSFGGNPSAAVKFTQEFENYRTSKSEESIANLTSGKIKDARVIANKYFRKLRGLFPNDYANDLSQDFLLVLLEALRKGKISNVENPHNYTFGIFKNTMGNRARRAKLEGKLPELDITASVPLQSPEELAEKKQLLEKLNRRLSELKNKKIGEYLLRNADGESYHEIAQSEGISESTIRRHCKKAKAILKKSMGAV